MFRYVKRKLKFFSIFFHANVVGRVLWLGHTMCCKWSMSPEFQSKQAENKKAVACRPPATSGNGHTPILKHPSLQHVLAVYANRNATTNYMYTVMLLGKQRSNYHFFKYSQYNKSMNSILTSSLIIWKKRFKISLIKKYFEFNHFVQLVSVPADRVHHKIYDIG